MPKTQFNITEKEETLGVSRVASWFVTEERYWRKVERRSRTNVIRLADEERDYTSYDHIKRSDQKTSSAEHQRRRRPTFKAQQLARPRSRVSAACLSPHARNLKTIEARVTKYGLRCTWQTTGDLEATGYKYGFHFTGQRSSWQGYGWAAGVSGQFSEYFAKEVSI